MIPEFCNGCAFFKFCANLSSDIHKSVFFVGIEDEERIFAEINKSVLFYVYNNRRAIFSGQKFQF